MPKRDPLLFGGSASRIDVTFLEGVLKVGPGRNATAGRGAGGRRPGHRRGRCADRMTTRRTGWSSAGGKPAGRSPATSPSITPTCINPPRCGPTSTGRCPVRWTHRGSRCTGSTGAWRCACSPYSGRTWLPRCRRWSRRRHPWRWPRSYGATAPTGDPAWPASRPPSTAPRPRPRNGSAKPSGSARQSWPGCSASPAKPSPSGRTSRPASAPRPRPSSRPPTCSPTDSSPAGCRWSPASRPRRTAGSACST